MLLLRRKVSFGCACGGTVGVAALRLEGGAAFPKEIPPWLEREGLERHAQLRGGFVASRLAALEASTAVAPKSMLQGADLSSRLSAGRSGIGVSFSHEGHAGAAAVWVASEVYGRFAVDLVDIARIGDVISRKPLFPQRWLGLKEPPTSHKNAAELWAVREVLVKLIAVDSRAVCMGNVSVTVGSRSGNLGSRTLAAVAGGEDGAALDEQRLQRCVVIESIDVRVGGREMLLAVGHTCPSRSKQ